MGIKTAIEWTDKTWNVSTGCSKVSAGCKNCYAERMINRFAGKSPAYPNGFDLTLKPHKLRDPFSYQEPSMVFVNSMSDLFHHEVPFEYIDQVMGVIHKCPQHVFQVLTKRPGRAVEYFDHYLNGEAPLNKVMPSNLWLGTSVENRATIDRIRSIKECPARVHFVSFEPLLEDVCCGHLADVVAHSLDWAIIGGESGHGARPCKLEWVENLVKFCDWHGVSVFVKQMGSAWAGSAKKKGGNPDEWPEHLRVREFPEVNQ